MNIHRLVNDANKCSVWPYLDALVMMYLAENLRSGFRVIFSVDKRLLSLGFYPSATVAKGFGAHNGAGITIECMPDNNHPWRFK